MLEAYFKFEDHTDDEFLDKVFEDKETIPCAYCNRKIGKDYGGLFTVAMIDNEEEPWLYLLFCTPMCRSLRVIGGLSMKTPGLMVKEARGIYNKQHSENADNQDE